VILLAKNYNDTFEFVKSYIQKNYFSLFSGHSVYVSICMCDCVSSAAQWVPFVLFGTNSSRLNVVKRYRQLPQSDDISLYECEHNGLPASHMVRYYSAQLHLIELIAWVGGG